MKTRLLALSLVLALTLMPALAPAESLGTLVADDGNDVYDFELRELIDIYIGSNYESMILAFTQCYGGDHIDNFSDLGNTAILSGGAPGTTTDYGGYHASLGQNLTPGSDTDTAHAAGEAGASSGDSPTTAGTNQTIGGTGSTHVLIWAGQPNNLDQDDIDNLVNNFGGQPNTTVTVLSGDGTGANTDGAATMDNLIDSLDDIGDQMGPDEQFVLFVTDHGNLDEGVFNFNLDNGFAQITDLDMTAYFDMIADPNNIPSLTLASSIDPFSLVNNIGTVTLNGNTVFDSGIDSFFDVFAEIQFDFDNDGITDQYRLTATLLESWFNPLDNVIGFTYEGDSPLPLDLVALNSGAISRKIIPEPTSMTLMALGILMAARRGLKRRPN